MSLIRIIVGVATLCIVFSSTPAKADTITASLYTALPPPGITPTLINLSGIVPPSQAPVTGTGYSIAFSGVGGTKAWSRGLSAVLMQLPLQVSLGNHA
ncbi:MAG: hypothetical protein JO182_00410 [Acidobacteriaceae bacterium]|nr:hypothetical protein [Acidobacteriaceae bacterium]